MAGPADVGHAAEAWLCLLPESARRFRVTDPRLAAALRGAGAELVENSPDVEIGGLRGDASLGVLSIGQPGWARGSLPARIGRRAAATARVRARAVSAGRALRRVGYTRTDVVTWDLGHAFRVAGMAPARSDAVEYLPQCALVFGRSGETGPSLAEASLAEAGAGMPSRLTARGGLVLAAAEEALVRIAVGPARHQIDASVAALSVLRERGLSDPRVPFPSASGRTGIADWAVEPLLPGTPASGPLGEDLAAECVDFLVALHQAGRPGDSPASLAEAAAVVARACGGACAETVLGIGMRLDASLGGVPRGFAHGDFFGGNLLVSGGRLAGVVDWDSAGPGRLAVIDLLHLWLTSREPPLDLDWGPALVRELLPWVRGGDSLTRSYCARVGMDPDPRVLELLVAAYWLDHAAAQLRSHAEHWEDRAWIGSNIESVARSLRLPT